MEDMPQPGAYTEDGLKKRPYRRFIWERHENRVKMEVHGQPESRIALKYYPDRT